jgi:hypothetical protein
MAAELLADTRLGGVELAFAAVAGNQQPHDSPRWAQL